MPTTIVNPVSELRQFVLNSKAIATATRCYHELIGWEAAEDIAADICGRELKISRQTYIAAIEDEEAAKSVEAAIADGKVTTDELGELRKAIRQIRSSAQRDRQIAEATTL